VQISEDDLLDVKELLDHVLKVAIEKEMSSDGLLSIMSSIEVAVYERFFRGAMDPRDYVANNRSVALSILDLPNRSEGA